MRNEWVPLNETGAAHLLTGLSKLAAAMMRLQLAEKLEQGRKTLALLQRSHEIENERHEPNTGRSAQEE